MCLPVWLGLSGSPVIELPVWMVLSGSLDVFSLLSLVSHQVSLAMCSQWICLQSSFCLCGVRLYRLLAFACLPSFVCLSLFFAPFVSSCCLNDKIMFHCFTMFFFFVFYHVLPLVAYLVYLLLSQIQMAWPKIETLWHQKMLLVVHAHRRCNG